MPEATVEPTKKKTPRRRKTTPKPKSFTSEEVDKLIEKATQRAEEKLQARFEEEQMKREFDITDQDSHTPNFDGGLFGSYHEMPGMEEPDSMIAETEEALNAFDLFEYVQTNFIGAGTPVKYQVKKDGTLMGELSHPCSWTKIQKKWGEGHYTVAAKKRTDNQYIKQQTLDLGPIDEPEEEAQNKINEQLLALASQTHQPQAPQIDMTAMMTQMMTMFQQFQQMNHTDKKSEERDQRKSENQYNQTMLQLMQGQQQSAQTMFMEMTKSTQSIVEKMNENMIRSQEKMDDKFSRMFEKLAEQSNKKEQFGTLDLLKMMKEAEDNGWSKMQMLMELSEARAAEKEESGGSDGMIGKLIGGILPLLSGAQQQQAMILNQQRGALPQAQPRPSTQNPRVRANPNPPQRRTAPQGHQAGLKNPVGVPGLIFDEIPKGKPTGGAASVSRTPEIIEADAVIDAKPARPERPVPSPVAAASARPETLDDILNQSSDIQRSIAEVAVPKIAEGLMTSQDPRRNAEESLNLVWSGLQLGAKDVLENFPFDFMLRIAGAFGIGEEAIPWFKEFYAHIEDQTGMDIEGASEPATDPEPQLGIW